LNVDYPFNLTGILYFPKVKNNIELQRNKIQLYCNQVFVTDSVEGIVPEFLTLLHGVIDSPDIPLNVSRSYLQSDSNVKKISSHITKKVADRLQEIFKSDRSQYEEKWDNLSLFVVYGMLTEEKFYEKAEKFMLFKNTDKKYFTLEEYKTLITTEQTDKDGNLIVLYTNNTIDQHSYIETAKAKGYDVIILDGQLDNHLINTLEQKNEKMRFVRVDADVVERLIVKEDLSSTNLTDTQRDALTTVFRSQVPKMDKTEFMVTFENLGSNALPIIITQQEFMRRMKDMSAMGGGMMSFYGEMPDSYNLVVNTANPIIERILKATESACNANVAPILAEKKKIDDRITDINTENKDKKYDEISQESKDEKSALEKNSGELRSKADAIYSEFAKENKEIRQVIDLALLNNNMLRGEALSNFVKRSIDLMK
jgi:molecular chaperone HtpG